MVFWGSVSVGKHVFGPSMESMMDQEKIHVYTLTMLTFAILDAVLFCLLRMTASSPPGQRNTPGSWAMAHMIMLFSHISHGSAVFALAYTVALLVGWYTLILTPVLGVAMNDLLGKNQNQQVHQKPPAPASYTPGKSSNDMRSPTGSLRSRGGGEEQERKKEVCTAPSAPPTFPGSSLVEGDGRRNNTAQQSTEGNLARKQRFE